MIDLERWEPLVDYTLDRSLEDIWHTGIASMLCIPYTHVSMASIRRLYLQHRQDTLGLLGVVLSNIRRNNILRFLPKLGSRTLGIDVQVYPFYRLLVVLAMFRPGSFLRRLLMTQVVVLGW